MALPVAIQLFSVREAFTKDPAGTLRKIKEIGYDGVEPAGFCGMTPERFRGLCDGVGLRMISIHISIGTMAERPFDFAVDCAHMGLDYATLPYLVEHQLPGGEYFNAFAAEIRNVSKELNRLGISLCYHNHTGEFRRVNGDYVLDELMSAFTPDELKLQLDTCWATHCGADPVAFLKRYKGRMPMIHLKDYKLEKDDEGNDKTVSCSFGCGVVNAEGIISIAASHGVKWLVYEQDNPDEGLDELGAAELSYKNIMKYNV